MEPLAAVRDFNRFYTNVIGLLRSGLVDTPYTLTEARVLFELAHQDAVEAATLRRDLDIDAGYLSRILGRFESDGLVDRARSAADGRRQVIKLTEPGRAAFGTLDERSAVQIQALLDRLPPTDQQRLVAAMGEIRDLLDGSKAPRSYLIRAPKPGELGWVVARNGAIYAAEYGWDASYEALVAKIVADFAATSDPAHEAAWVAEVDGVPAGCVFCVRRDVQTAQLRLLLVEPSARGLGIGSRLVVECLDFARKAGYRRIMLWTNDVLADARRIYQRAGFALDEQSPHRAFGKDLVQQVWSRDL